MYTSQNCSTHTPLQNLHQFHTTHRTEAKALQSKDIHNKAITQVTNRPQQAKETAEAKAP